MARHKRITLLVSGGVESWVITALARRDHPSAILHGIFVNYGQRAGEPEMESVTRLSRRYGVQLEVAEVMIPGYSDHILVDETVVQYRNDAAQDYGFPTPRHPEDTKRSVVLHYRNVVFVAMAAAHAACVGSREVWTGFDPRAASTAGDKSAAFVRSMTRTLAVSTLSGVRGVKIVTPLIENTKADTVELGQKLSVPWRESWSCYNRFVLPCGVCDACYERRVAFAHHGIEEEVCDPEFVRAQISGG